MVAGGKRWIWADRSGCGSWHIYWFIPGQSTRIGFPPSATACNVALGAITSEYQNNSAEKADLLTALRIPARALAVQLHGDSQGQYFTSRIVCQSDKLGNVFRYDCWRVYIYLELTDKASHTPTVTSQKKSFCSEETSTLMAERTIPYHLLDGD